MAFPREHSEQSWFTKSLTLGSPSQKGHWFGISGQSTLKWHPQDPEGGWKARDSTTKSQYPSFAGCPGREFLHRDQCALGKANATPGVA